MNRRRPASPQGADGHVALEFALVVGLFLLPVAVLATAFPVWVERQALARVAAQEAARTIAVSDEVVSGQAAAEAMVAAVAASHGLDDEDLHICAAAHPADEPPPETCGLGAALPRGVAVTVSVTVPLPALTFPGFPVALPVTAYTARHTEVVDHFRSLP